MGQWFPGVDRAWQEGTEQIEDATGGAVEDDDLDRAAEFAGRANPFTGTYAYIDDTLQAFRGNPDAVTDDGMPGTSTGQTIGERVLPDWAQQNDPTDPSDNGESPIIRLITWIMENPGIVVGTLVLLYVMPALASGLEVAANVTGE